MQLVCQVTKTGLCGFMRYELIEIGSVLIFKHDFKVFYPSSNRFKHFQLSVYNQLLVL